MSAAEESLGYAIHDVPVDGGRLRVGVWEPTHGEPAATILVIHGITGNHVCWWKLAVDLADVRVIAPDLRGRGRSNHLPGPYGMERHAEDLVQVLQHFDTGPVPIVGHSMGAFVAATLADRHPEWVQAVALLDGGVPLPGLPDLAGEEFEAYVEQLLGPAADRLTQTFPDRESYRALFRGHPALGSSWGTYLEAYVDYDLSGTEPKMVAATRREAMLVDSADLYRPDGPAAQALARWSTPGVVVRAGRGLMDDDPIYPDGYLGARLAELPDLRLVELPQTNHYTLVLGEGTGPVADVVRGIIG